MDCFSIWIVDPLDIDPTCLRPIYPIFTEEQGKLVESWDTLEGAKAHYKIRDKYNDWYYANRYVPKMAEAGSPFHSMEEAVRSPLYGEPEPFKPEGWDIEESENIYAILKLSIEGFQGWVDRSLDFDFELMNITKEDVLNAEDIWG